MWKIALNKGGRCHHRLYLHINVCTFLIITEQPETVGYSKTEFIYDTETGRMHHSSTSLSLCHIMPPFSPL